ncbi:MAG: zinc ribbon domain-containing protein [Pseudomonadota bacterium]
MSLTLQVCQDCGALQYPRRDVCGQCLSPNLKNENVSAQGTVLSWTQGHFSVLPAFKDKTPLTLVRVKLDGGAVVLALAKGPLATHARVLLAMTEGLLIAVAT